MQTDVSTFPQTNQSMQKQTALTGEFAALARRIGDAGSDARALTALPFITDQIDSAIRPFRGGGQVADDTVGFTQTLNEIADRSGFTSALAGIDRAQALRAAQEMNAILVDRGMGLSGRPGYRSDAEENATEYRLASIAHTVFQGWDAAGLNEALVRAAPELAKVIADPDFLLQFAAFEKHVAAQALADASLIVQLIDGLCAGPLPDLDDYACALIAGRFQFQDLTFPVLLGDVQTISDDNRRTLEQSETPWWLKFAGLVLAIVNGTAAVPTAGLSIASIFVGGLVDVVPREVITRFFEFFLTGPTVAGDRRCRTALSGRVDAGFTRLFTSVTVSDWRTRKLLANGGPFVLTLRLLDARTLTTPNNVLPQTLPLDQITGKVTGFLRRFDDLPSPASLRFETPIPQGISDFIVKVDVLANPNGYRICRSRAGARFRAGSTFPR